MEKLKKFSRREVLQSMAVVAAATLIKPASIFSAAPAQNKVRFAVMGDWCTGDSDGVGIARHMANRNRRSPLDLVCAAGDNIYPDGSPRHFSKNFERPFSPIIGDRVNFYAVLGNHDIEDGRRDQCQYPLFNMGGKAYYTIKQGDGLA